MDNKKYIKIRGAAEHNLKNIDIDIEDCVIGSVRVGNQIDVSEKFID